MDEDDMWKYLGSFVHTRTALCRPDGLMQPPSFTYILMRERERERESTYDTSP